MQRSLKPKLRARPYKFKGRDRYMSTFGRDKLKVIKDPFVTERLKTVGLRPDPAPRSVYKVEKLYQALDEYSSFPTIRRDEHFERGVRLAHRAFACRDGESKLTAMLFASLPDCVKGDTSAGITAYPGKKRDNIELGMNKAIAILLGDIAPEPCLAFARTQKNDKTRLVWGYPMTMTLIEAIFARPLIDYFKVVHSPMHFGVSTSITSSKIRGRARERSLGLSLDYSRFDSSISSPFLYAAFKILQTWFDNDQEYLVPGGSIKLSDVWNLIVRYFVNGPIVMPDGNMYTGRKGGVPSGSFFTQIIDSIVNVILAGMVISKFQLHISTKDILVLGDDCLLFSDESPDFVAVARYLSSYGFTLNPDKCEVCPSNAVRFLGRTWVHGEPEEDLQTLVDKLCYPERFRKYSSDPEVREREIDLLIRSYASEYMNFAGVFLRCIQSHGPINFEMAHQMIGRGDVSPKFLSGLARFRRDYLGSGTGSSLGSSIWK